MGKFYSNFSKANQLLDGNILIFLDLVRGISAILVVMAHLSSRLFVGYGHLENPNIFVKLLYLINLLGNPAVIIFFVISGLFISRSVLKAIYEDKWSWQSYLINRFSRLLVVLVPALLITFILDSLAVQFGGYKGYDSISSNLIELIGNLFFLQNIYVNSYGSNAPLWSLSFEFWYYMLFPLLACLFLNKESKTHMLLYTLLVFSIVSVIGIRMNTYFIIWLIGPLVLFLPKVNSLTHKFFKLTALMVLFLSMIVHPLAMTGRLFFINQELKDLMQLFGVNLFVGLSFGFLTYSLLHGGLLKMINIEVRSIGKFAKLISSFSFSLYLIHYPIINVVYYWLAANGYTGLQPSVMSVIFEVFIVFMMCVFAYLFSLFTEAKTHLLRDFIKTRTNRLISSQRGKMLNKQKEVV
ncbi:acyltransferase family protein [Bacillus pinisoli]|uniref:acyltransferase family protein n=1 Tax=Bacillus pinisoli TaxID=2901866 RepID=UPI001FF2BB97|nr:acyltransferase [Bacillus pinisoli]